MIRIRVYDDMMCEQRLEGSERIKQCGRTFQAERTVRAKTLGKKGACFTF